MANLPNSKSSDVGKVSSSSFFGLATMLLGSTAMVLIGGVWYVKKSYHDDLEKRKVKMKEKAERRKEKKAQLLAREKEGLTKEELLAFLKDQEEEKKTNIKKLNLLARKLQGYKNLPRQKLEAYIQEQFLKLTIESNKKLMKKHNMNEKMFEQAREKYKHDPLIIQELLTIPKKPVAQKSTPKIVVINEPEEKVAKSEEKVTKSEEKVAKSEEKVAKSEEKAAKSEEKAVKSEEKAAKPEEETVGPEAEIAKPKIKDDAE